MAIQKNKPAKENALTTKEMYNHSTIRNVTVIFGSLFSNMHIRKYNKDGTIDKNNVTLVPITYASKQQYNLWAEQQMRLPPGNIEINNKFPRISYEMNGLQVAPERGVNTNLPIYTKAISASGKTLRSRTPISYSFDFTLTLWCKQMDDSIQLLDQILPMFTPEVSIKVKESIKLNIINDVIIVMNSISKTDDYQSGFEQNTLIQWDLSFTVYADIMPEVEESTVIQRINLDTLEAITEAYINGTQPPFFVNKYEIEATEKATTRRRNRNPIKNK